MLIPHHGSAPPLPRRRSVLEAALVVLVVAAVCLLYLWTASSDGNAFALKGRGNDYYNLLTHGFLEGHLYMKVAPVANKPAEPDVNGLGNLPYLLDASFYQGKYYLYFGPTPVLVAFLPYRLLTGGDISDNLVAALFACAGYMVSLGLLWLVRRRFFPRASWCLMPLFAVLLGLGNVCVVMLRHPLFYEAAIACAFFFQSLFFVGLYLALTTANQRRRVVGLALASLACGLSVGARANYAFSSLALVMVLFWFWRQRPEPRAIFPRSLWALAAAAFGPVTLCAVGLMAYNYLRFGNVFEFGVSYQFTYRPVFSPRFLPHNLSLYYFSLPELSWYFPFTMPINEGIRPPGYVGFEHIHGQACASWLLPTVLCAAGFLWSRRFAAERSLAMLFACGLFVYLSNFLVLLCLAGRANRYMVDFQATLMLLGAISILTWDREIAWTLRVRRCMGTLLGLLVLLIGVYNLCVSIQLYELLKQSNPRVYDKIATVMNAPTHWAGRELYPRQGSIELRMQFPAGTKGDLEPLVFTGSAEYCDFLGVRYLGPGQIRFEMIHYGYQEITSAPVSITAGRTYEVEIDLGSLYPPLAHPFFRPFSHGETVLIKRTVQVRLDGQVVFAARHDFYDASPNRIYLGENPLAPLFSKARFTGRIESVARAGLAPLLKRKAQRTQGPVLLHLSFPADMTNRLPEPLVLTGVAGRGDAIFVKYENAHEIRFGFDHWGGGVVLSGPVEVDPRVPHVLEIWMGSLFPPVTDPQFSGLSPFEIDQLKSTARVKIDGREVFRARSQFHDADPDTVDLGSNYIGMSTFGGLFTGEILEYDRVAPQLDRNAGDSAVALGPVWMPVTFPSGRAGQNEPLLVTGAGGRGDVVFVNYLDDHRVRFGLDHWGSPTIFSAPIPLNYAVEHGLEIDMGSLYPAEGLAQLSPARVSRVGKVRHQIRIRLDDREVFAARSDFYAAAPREFEVGGNRIGASSCGPLFTGIIGNLKRLGFGSVAASPLPAQDYGPIILELSFPKGRSGLSEPLLVTGHTGAADALVVTYVDDGHVKLTWDHWGVGGPSSALIPVEYDEWYLLKVEMGSLYPDSSAALKKALVPEEIARRRQTMRVTFDDMEVLSAQGPFYPARIDEVRIGTNSIGLSSAVGSFTGVIEQSRRPGVSPLAK
jgi:hypothetical protein